MAATSPADKSAHLADLLARSALGNQGAFEELYRTTSGRLYAIALRLLRDRALAEEVLQDAFVSVWHHAGSYATTKSQPLTWLASIVRNRSLDLLRRRELETVPMTRGDTADETGTDVEFPSDRPSPVDMLLQAADASAVRQCVE